MMLKVESNFSIFQITLLPYFFISPAQNDDLPNIIKIVQVTWVHKGVYQFKIWIFNTFIS